MCAISEGGPKHWWYVLCYFSLPLWSNTYLGAPCVTQSDLGTENYNVAYAHTHIRHTLDPALEGSIQHKWKPGHTNIKPEQMWSRFRRTWVPGFENLLERGLQKQWYDIVNVGDRCVYHISIETSETYSIST